MAHLTLAFASLETPMERIFEKVMLRKMTKVEKKILELSAPLGRIRKHAHRRATVSHKIEPRSHGQNAAKLTSN